MQSNTYGPKYFRPNEPIPNSRSVITQEIQRHHKALLNIKPTIKIQPTTALANPRPDSRFNPQSAPKQITLNPYNTEALYQIKRQQDHPEEVTPPFASGMTQSQWKNINEFQIVGQSQRKKQNYHIAIDHYFNLRAMYRRINAIKYKRQLGSDISTSQSMHRKSDEVAIKPRKQIRQLITKPLHNYHLNKDIYYHDQKQAFDNLQPKSAEKPKKAQTGKNQRIQSAVANSHNQHAPEVKKVTEAAVKAKKTKKKKIKPENKDNEAKNYLSYQVPKELKPKAKHFEVDDFKNTNEKELIEENLGLARKGKREVDFDDFVIEQRLANARKEASHATEQPKAKRQDEVMQDYGDFLHKPKNKENLREELLIQKGLKPEANNANVNSQGKSKAPLYEKHERNPTQEEKLAPISLRLPDQDTLNPKSRAIREEVEAEEQDGARSHDSENFELTNFQDKIKKSEPPQSADEKASDPDDDDIMTKIPYLEDQTEEGLQTFKQQLIQMIFDYEIYNEEEFNNFYSAVCMKNEELGPELIEEVFNEIKEFLYEQFQELTAEDGQGEGEHTDPNSRELDDEEDDDEQ